ncbi:GerMN domain-containing protein [Salsuginibacillus kocurii]|uniref:GerMN domain-containing protein n=1 Tax=Salsuginibacillus kocurii TaxID=427078 RepID=UPI00037A7372|nr:GerMN domain-containing protein [Salsuginibacillus kocurii]
MKKPLFLTLFTTAFVLAACGEGEDPEETAGEDQTEDAAVEEETEDEEEETDTEDDLDEEEEGTEEGTEEDEGDAEEDADVDTSSDEEETDEDEVEEGTEEDEESTYTEVVNLYFPDEQLMNTYYEEREVTAEEEDALPEAAVQAWLDGPESEELYPLVEGATVQSIEGEDDTARVSFDEAFLEANVGSGGEMEIVNQVALIMEQFGYSETVILIDGEEQESLFGHLEGTEAFPAPDASDYEAVEEAEEVEE